MPDLERTARSAYASPKHPHEPEIPPVLDPEGRCLVCRLECERDVLRRAIVEHRTAITNAGMVKVQAGYERVAEAKHGIDKRLWEAVS